MKYFSRSLLLGESGWHFTLVSLSVWSSSEFPHVSMLLWPVTSLPSSTSPPSGSQPSNITHYFNWWDPAFYQTLNRPETEIIFLSVCQLLWKWSEINTLPFCLFGDDSVGLISASPPNVVLSSLLSDSQLWENKYFYLIVSNKTVFHFLYHNVNQELKMTPSVNVFGMSLWFVL